MDGSEFLEQFYGETTYYDFIYDLFLVENVGGGIY